MRLTVNGFLVTPPSRPTRCQRTIPDCETLLGFARSLSDLGPLKSLGLHKLKGDRRGQWAMTVNDRWRICFEFRKGDAHEVEIVDYHRG